MRPEGEKRRTLVFGATGMLGQSVMALGATEPFSNLLEMEGLGSADCDLTDGEAVAATVREHAPDVIINCAAYTAVDMAEDNEEAADRLNRLAPKYLANAAKEANALLIHVSTDYVFDGTGHTPYRESETTAPLGAYGRTKRDGEKEILATGCDSVIVRTQWLYSHQAKNFFLTMLRLFGQREEINVVADQTGSPTLAANLGRALLRIATQFAPGRHMGGIYHFADQGECSWYDFAAGIAMLAETECRLHPIATDQYPTKARRPHYSALCTDKIYSTFDLDDCKMGWRKAARLCYQAWEDKQAAEANTN